MTIEKHPKSIIVKHAQLLADIILVVYDLRRSQASNGSNSFSAEAIEAIERKARECTIKMIMKMNDTAFRPIFVKLVEWADVGLPEKDRQGRVLRLIAIYGLIEEFFSTLKVQISSIYFSKTSRDAANYNTVHCHKLCKLYYRQRGGHPQERKARR